MNHVIIFPELNNASTWLMRSMFLLFVPSCSGELRGKGCTNHIRGGAWPEQEEEASCFGARSVGDWTCGAVRCRFVKAPGSPSACRGHWAHQSPDVIALYQNDAAAGQTDLMKTNNRTELNRSLSDLLSSSSYSSKEIIQILIKFRVTGCSRFF